MKCYNYLFLISVTLAQITRAMSPLEAEINFIKKRNRPTSVPTTKVEREELYGNSLEMPILHDAQFNQSVQEGNLKLYAKLMKEIYECNKHVAYNILYDGDDSNATYTNLLHYIIGWGCSDDTCSLSPVEKDKKISTMIALLLRYNAKARKVRNPLLDVNMHLRKARPISWACFYEYVHVVKELLTIPELKISPQEIRWASHFPQGLIAIVRTKGTHLVKMSHIVTSKEYISSYKDIIEQMQKGDIKLNKNYLSDLEYSLRRSSERVILLNKILVRNRQKRLKK